MARKVKEFTVDRATWLRGEGSAQSSLLREQDGKMCCLGFLCLAQGVQRRCLLNLPVPDMLSAASQKHLPAFLVKPKDATMGDIMPTNDNRSQTDKKRERHLKRLFKRQGVAIKFVGEG